MPKLKEIPNVNFEWPKPFCSEIKILELFGGKIISNKNVQSPNEKEMTEFSLPMTFDILY